MSSDTTSGGQSSAEAKRKIDVLGYSISVSGGAMENCKMAFLKKVGVAKAQPLAEAVDAYVLAANGAMSFLSTYRNHVGSSGWPPASFAPVQVVPDHTTVQELLTMIETALTDLMGAFDGTPHSIEADNAFQKVSRARRLAEATMQKDDPALLTTVVGAAGMSA